jgi:hypothetical protein
MINPKLINLVFKLRESTDSGSLRWAETEDERLYQASFARNSVRIGERRSRYDDSASEYFILVMNSDGDLVAELGDEDVTEEEVGEDRRLQVYVDLKATFEAARGQASGVDDILDEISEEIDRGGLPL